MTDTVISLAECRELAELLGICWHYPACPTMMDVGRPICKKCKQIIFTANPNFLDPVVVLKEMAKRADWRSFAQHIAYTAQGIEDYTIDTTGKVALAALNWLS